MFPGALAGLILLGSIATERLTVETWKVMRALTVGYRPGKFDVEEWGIPKP